MKFYNSNSIESVVIFGRPSDTLRKEICERVIWSLGYNGQDHLDYDSNLLNAIDGFVFDGSSVCASWLVEIMTPAEFRMIVGLRVWYKAIDKQFKYRSPKLWTRSSDYVIVNLNDARSVVFIDAHYWVD